MKSTVSSLTPKEREALALFYDTAAHKALYKLIDMDRIELAKDAIDQRDIASVRFLAGQAASLKALVLTLEDIYKKSQKI